MNQCGTAHSHIGIVCKFAYISFSTIAKSNMVERLVLACASTINSMETQKQATQTLGTNQGYLFF